MLHVIIVILLFLCRMTGLGFYTYVYMAIHLLYVLWDSINYVCIRYTYVCIRYRYICIRYRYICIR